MHTKRIIKYKGGKKAEEGSKQLEQTKHINLRDQNPKTKEKTNLIEPIWAVLSLFEFFSFHSQKYWILQNILRLILLMSWRTCTIYPSDLTSSNSKSPSASTCLRDLGNFTHLMQPSWNKTYYFLDEVLKVRINLQMRRKFRRKTRLRELFRG